MNSTSGRLEWCLISNGTYLDCPIKGKSKSDFIIALHNPSTIDREYIKIKVAHSHY